MSTETAESETERKSFGGLLSQILIDSAALLRNEIELSKQEMREKVKTLQSGLLAIAIGAMIGQIALILLCAAVAIKLADSVSFETSALTMGAGLALIGGLVALSGFRKLRQTNLKPQKQFRH